MQRRRHVVVLGSGLSGRWRGGEPLRRPRRRDQPSPAVAVDQADAYIKTGKADQPEKQSVDCVLVNPDNAKSVTNFAVATS